MSGINLKSVNKTILVGKVVGKVDSGKTAAGRDFVRFALETEEYFIVKGESKAVATKHDIVITNQYVVPAFKQNLKDGHYISLTGKLSHANGKHIVEVGDFGHEAQMMYIPPDSGRETPAAKPASKGGGFDMSQIPQKTGGRKPQDDDYFSPEAPLERRGPSKAPEGFSDDDIPF